VPSDELYMRIVVMRDVVHEMRAATASISRMLDQLEDSAKKHLNKERWDGMARYAYDVAKTNWDNAANELVRLLGQACDMLDQLVEAAKKINDGVVQMWSQYVR
jgi:uncharacterized protein YukE